MALICDEARPVPRADGEEHLPATLKAATRVAVSRLRVVEEGPPQKLLLKRCTFAPT